MLKTAPPVTCPTCVGKTVILVVHHPRCLTMAASLKQWPAASFCAEWCIFANCPSCHPAAR